MSCKKIPLNNADQMFSIQYLVTLTIRVQIFGEENFAEWIFAIERSLFLNLFLRCGTSSANLISRFWR